MNFKSVLFKAGGAIAPLVVMLALGGPSVQAKAPPIIIATSDPPTNCGQYNSSTAHTNLVTTINAATGGTILICPGIYTLASSIQITNAHNLTIKRALTDTGEYPRLRPANSVLNGMIVVTSTNVTIDGLVFDAGASTAADYTSIRFAQSSGAIRNSQLISPDTSGTTGFSGSSGTSTKTLVITISSTHFAGYHTTGVYVQGRIKLNMTSDMLDATDDGRLESGVSKGIFFDGQHPGPAPIGKVSRTAIVNTWKAILVLECSNVTIASNTLSSNFFGVELDSAGTLHGGNNNKVTGNSILVVESGIGILVGSNAANSYTSKNTIVTNNTIIAHGYFGSGFTEGMIMGGSPSPAKKTFTGTVSGNTFINFFEGSALINSGINGVKVKNNTITR